MLTPRLLDSGITPLQLSPPSCVVIIVWLGGRDHQWNSPFHLDQHKPELYGGTDAGFRLSPIKGLTKENQPINQEQGRTWTKNLGSLEFVRATPTGLAKNMKVSPALHPEEGISLTGMWGLRQQLALPLLRGSPPKFPSLLCFSPGGFSGQVNPFLPSQGFATYLQSFPHEFLTRQTAVTGHSCLALIWCHQPACSICANCGLLPAFHNGPWHLDLNSLPLPLSPPDVTKSHLCHSVKLVLTEYFLILQKNSTFFREP